MLEGKGRFLNRPTTTGGKKYDKFFIYLSTKLATDSSFPFKEGEEVAIRIEDQQLIISKTSKEE